MNNLKIAVKEINHKFAVTINQNILKTNQLRKEIYLKNQNLANLMASEYQQATKKNPSFPITSLGKCRFSLF